MGKRKSSPRLATTSTEMLLEIVITKEDDFIH